LSGVVSRVLCCARATSNGFTTGPRSTIAFDDVSLGCALHQAIPRVCHSARGVALVILSRADLRIELVLAKGRAAAPRGDVLQVGSSQRSARELAVCFGRNRAQDACMGGRGAGGGVEGEEGFMVALLRGRELGLGALRLRGAKLEERCEGVGGQAR
jgi:hypothetical protein